MIRLTKIFTFETAHALAGYDGKCKNVHGHSYKLHVTVKGNPIEDTNHVKCGMVIDFGDLKKIVNEEIVDVLDHAVVINKESAYKEMGERLESEGHNVVFVAYQPTCEMMLGDFAEKIAKKLSVGVTLAELKLYETETSYGEWLAEDQK